ncbi:MAG: sensor histidine kinase [Eggerthellaceae bacterium]|nr:sensor histidine kinase [Eggerthellaceae bacterium]
MGNQFLNYLLEFAMMFPAAAMALMPCRGHLRFRARTVHAAAFGCVLALTVLGSLSASYSGVPTNYILVPFSLLLLAPLLLVSALDRWKTVYCFLNAAMLCAFSTMYATYATAPWEVDNTLNVFTVQSGAACLAIALVACALFARTLLVKLPALFANAGLDALWKWLSLAPIAITAFVFWMTPVSAENVMVGYVLPKGLAITSLIPLFVWFLHHIAWLTASRTEETVRLEHENELLKLEGKRQSELIAYIDDAQTMRHDFRHHMAVIGELLSAGKADEARAYSDVFIESSTEKHTSFYCENGAVDAIAAHYDSLATAIDIESSWCLDIQRNLPVKETDFCSVLGNLVENAINAAGKCDEGSRWLKVKASALPDGVVTITVQNSFAEPVKLSADGIPTTQRADHGIGSISVAAISNKYDGSFKVSSENGTFTASVLLYPPG